MKSSLDTSKNAVVSSSNQEFRIDGAGLRGKQYVDGVYSDKEVWINNATITFTDDAWETARLALGSMTLNGLPLYGLIADAIVGNLIIGDSLTIANENNSFVVDSTGATLIDADFTITTTDGLNKIILSPENGLTIQQQSGGVYTDKFYADTNGNLTLEGIIRATGGIFQGDVQAQRYLDASGEDMFVDGKFEAEYLNLKGLNINDNFIVDENGNVTINGGSISWGAVSGTEALDQRLDDIEVAADDAASAASSAASIARRIANGTYSSGSFIRNREIYSPTIYATEFNVVPENRTDISGSYNIHGNFDGNSYHFLKIGYSGMEYPTVRMYSPQSAAFHIGNEDTGVIYADGTWDFRKAIVENLYAKFR